MARAVEVPITPEVLTWAIQTSGFSDEEIAARTKVELSALRDWMNGVSRPSLTQFRAIARTLKRPASTLLLPSPPESVTPAVEFRRPIDSDRKALNPKELRYLREVARLQKALSWAAKKTGASKVALPSIRVSADPASVASEARKALGIDVTEQMAWRDANQAFKEWRRGVEELGIIVFLLPLGGESVRGFSVWDPFVPAIAVSSAVNDAARVFSLVHELAHLYTRTSSACVERGFRSRVPAPDAVERWCERFAAALLAPWEDVLRVLREEFGWRTGEVIQDLAPAERIARVFRISLRASVLRLIENGVADWDLYKLIPPASDQKRGGGGGGGRDRPRKKLDEYGRRTVRLFLSAIEKDIYDRHAIADYLDVDDVELGRLTRGVFE